MIQHCQTSPACLLRGDISSVPAEDLGNLARCIGDTVHIEAVCGDLGPVLSNIKCRKLILGQVALSQADTGSLVAAMVRGVKDRARNEPSPN